MATSRAKLLQTVSPQALDTLANLSYGFARAQQLEVALKAGVRLLGGQTLGRVEVAEFQKAYPELMRANPHIIANYASRVNQVLAQHGPEAAHKALISLLGFTGNDAMQTGRNLTQAYWNEDVVAGLLEKRAEREQPPLSREQQQQAELERRQSPVYQHNLDARDRRQAVRDALRANVNAPPDAVAGIARAFDNAEREGMHPTQRIASMLETSSKLRGNLESRRDRGENIDRRDDIRQAMIEHDTRGIANDYVASADAHAAIDSTPPAEPSPPTPSSQGA